VYTSICVWKISHDHHKSRRARVPPTHRDFLESDIPVAVTRRGETLGVYVPTRRKRPRTAELSELKAAADRLAAALANVDEDDFVK
jgi:hypothetical protein